MEGVRLRRDVISLNAASSACETRWAMALELQRAASKDVVTRNALLLGCARGAAWEVALQAERGDLIGENGRLRACAAHWQLVIQLLRTANAVTFNAFVAALESSERPQLALHCLQLTRGHALELLKRT